MIDHMGIPVSNIESSRKFYEAALGALGMSVQMEVASDQAENGWTALGFGVPGEKIFWIGDGDKVGTGIHVAFTADSQEQVDAFHAAGLKAGGRDNGKPGPRPNYGPNYYAAFVFDPPQTETLICISPFDFVLCHIRLQDFGFVFDWVLELASRSSLTCFRGPQAAPGYHQSHRHPLHPLHMKADPRRLATPAPCPEAQDL